MLISASIGICAGHTGCETAKDYLNLSFDHIHEFSGPKTKENLTDYFWALKNIVANTTTPPTIIGGDHSCAIGTWSGIAQKHGYFGLIWVDAHMDSHTPQTSISQNVHGMPLASLLGYGDFTDLTQPKLKPENLILIGIRSYEPEERELLERLGVTIYYDEDCRDINNVMQQAFNHFPPNLPLGISIDMDAFTQEDAPGVGTPEPGGLELNEFISAVKNNLHQPLAALEIVEFNPRFDVENTTANHVVKILENLTTHNITLEI